MEERFLQQLKKGVLELLVLQTICRGPTYGYELIAQLGSRSGGLFTLREGTLYPILYRLEDDGLIEAVWQQETGRAAPRKIYSATEKGREENERRLGLWAGFRTAVDHFCGEDAGHERKTACALSARCPAAAAAIGANEGPGDGRPAQLDQ